MRAADARPERPIRLLDCAHCGATWKACTGVQWLRGRNCCEVCDGHGTRDEGTSP